MLGVMTTNANWHPSDEFLHRLRQHYALSLAQYEPETSACWSGIASKNADVHQALTEADDAHLRDLLENPAKTNLYYGVDNLAADLVPIIAPLEGFGDFLTEQFNLLAEAIGTERGWNPEYNKSRPLVQADSIVDRLPFTVDFPNPFANEIGIQTKRGIASYRAIHAIYQAYRLRQEAERVGGAKLLEIGAGMGRTAFYAHGFGMTNYTIVDLPHMLIGQACFLAATLGEYHVSLLGDRRNSNAVQLMPPQSLKPDDRFDVALNADSMTEMSRDYAERYIGFIADRCRVFLSINHEANTFTVRELLGSSLYTRHPYPLRSGYFEEIWEPRKKGSLWYNMPSWLTKPLRSVMAPRPS